MSSLSAAEMTAGTRIALTWRRLRASRRTTHAMVADLQRLLPLSPPPAAASAASSSNTPPLEVLLTRRPLVDAAARFLTRVVPRKRARPRIDPRVFLSAFLLAQEVPTPAEDGQDGGEAAAQGAGHAAQPAALRDAALAMLDALATLTAYFLDGGSGGYRAARRSFRGAWLRYRKLFAQWKSFDQKVFVKELLDTMVMLERERRAADGPAAMEMYVKQGMIRQNIFRLVGPQCDAMIAEVMTKAFPPQPRTTPPSSPTRQTTAAQSTQAARTPGHSDSDSADSASSADEGVRTPAAAPKPSAIISANERIAHEMLMDPKYVGPVGANEDIDPLVKQVREVAERAFWDHFVTELTADPPRFDRAIELLVEVRESIVALTPRRKDVADELRAQVDADLVRQQVAANAFDVQRDLAPLLKYLVAKIRFLQAPAAQPATDEWVRGFEAELSEGNVARILPDAFKFMLAQVEGIRVDIAKFRMSMLRPLVEQHGVEYEREKFQSALATGDASLARTSDYFARAFAALREENALRDGVADVAKVHRRAMTLLLSGHEAVSPADAPELVLKDIGRLRQFQDRMQRITLVAAIIVLVSQVAGAVARERQDKMRRELTILLLSPTTRLPELVQAAVDAARENAGDAGLPAEKETLLRSLIDQVASTSHRVYALLHTKVRTAVLGATAQLDPLLQAFADDVASVRSDVDTFLKANLRIYEPFYTAVLRRVSA